MDYNTEQELIPEEDFLQNASSGLISEEDFIRDHEPKSPTFTEEAFNKYLVDQPDPAADLKKLSRRQDEILQAKKAQYLFSMSSEVPITADAHIERIKKESAGGISGIMKHFPVRYSKDGGIELTMDESFAPFQDIENDYEKNGLLSTVGTQTKRVLKNIGKGTLSFMMSAPQVLYGLIQEQAEKAGVDPSYLSEMESNPLLGFVSYGAKMVQKEIADRTDLDEKITGWAKKKITESKENLQKQGIVPEGDSVYDKLFFNLGSGGASLGTVLALSALTRSPAALKVLGPVVGEWAPMALFGAMEKANVYTDLRDKGVDVTVASRVSTVAGIANAFLEKWGVDNILKETSRPFLNMLRTGLVEGTEEMLQDFASGTLNIAARSYDLFLKGDKTGAVTTLFNKQEWKEMLDNAVYSGLIGALTGAPAGAIGPEMTRVMKERGVSDIGIEAINSRVDHIVKTALDKGFEAEDMDNRKTRALDESAPEILRMEAERLQAARQRRLTERIETPFEKEARERGIDLSQIEEARPEKAAVNQPAGAAQPGGGGRRVEMGGEEMIPKISTSTNKVKDIRAEKDLVFEKGFETKDVNDLIDKYYKPESYAAALQGQDNVYLVMPSTSGNNTIPSEFAYKLKQDFGGEIIEGYAKPLHKIQAKHMGAAGKLETPTQYKIYKKLSGFEGKNIVVVDDVINTGESLASLKSELRKLGVKNVNYVSLGSSEKRLTSEKDIDRISNKLAGSLNLDYNTVRDNVKTVLSGTNKQFANIIEKNLSGGIYERIQRRAGAIRENGKRAGNIQQESPDNAGASVRPGGFRKVQGMAAGETGQSEKVAPLQIFRTKEDVIVENTRGEKVTLKANDEYRIIPDEKDPNKVKLLDGKQVTVFTGELPKLPPDKITFLSEENQPQGGGRKRRPPAGEGYDKEWMHKASNEKIDNFIKYEEGKIGYLPIEVPPAIPEISKSQGKTVPASSIDVAKEKKIRPFREPKEQPHISPDQIKKIIRENTGQIKDFINVSESNALKIKLRAEAKGSKEAREYVSKIVRVLRSLQKEYKRPDLAIDYEYFQKVQDIQNGLDIKPYSPLWKLNLDELSAKLKEMNRLKKEGRQILMEKLVARKAEYDRIKSELTSNVGGVKTEGKIATIHNRENIGAWKRLVAHGSRVLNMPRLFDWLDGVKNYAGSHLKEIWWPAKQAEYKEISLQHEYADKRKALLDNYKIDKKLINKVEIFKDEKGVDQKFTHGELQKIFAWAGDLDGEINEKQVKAVLRTGIDEDMLKKMLQSLSENEKEYVRKSKKLLNEIYPDIQKVSIEVDNRPLKKEASYFPMDIDRDYLSWGDAFESDMTQRGYQAGSVAKGFRIERTDIERDVRLPLKVTDFTASLDYALNSHIHYISYRELEHKLNSITRDPDYKKAVLENRGETVWRQIEKWQDNILNPKTMYEKSNRVINELRKNISVASLGFKVLSAAKQLVNITMAPQYADMKDIFYNLKQLADPQTRGEITRFVNNAAPDIAEKKAMWEIQDLISSVPSAEKTKLEKVLEDVRNKITPAGMWMMTRFDYFIRVATFKSVYDSAVKAGLSDMEAKRKASIFNANSQNMMGVTDTSDLIRDRTFISLFTQFASQAHNITNMLVYDVPQAFKHKEYKRAVTTLITLVLNAAVLQAITHGFRPPDDEEEAGRWAWDAFTDLIPLISGGVNWVGKTMLGQPAYNPSLFNMPMKDAIEKIFEAGSDLMKEDYGKGAFKMAVAAGTLAGLPVPAVGTLLKGGRDIWEGKTNNPLRLFTSRTALGENKPLKGVSVETQSGKVIDQNYIDTIRRRGSKVSREVDRMVEDFTTSGMFPNEFYKSDDYKKRLISIKELFDENEFTPAVRNSLGKSIKSRMKSPETALAWAQYMSKHSDDKEKYKEMISRIRLIMLKKKYKQLPQMAGR